MARWRADGVGQLKEIEKNRKMKKEGWSMKDRDTPLRLVRKWKGAYGALDKIRAAKDDGTMEWPDWCELPIGAAYTYLVYVEKISAIGAAELAAELTACWIWRRSRKIYWFDADLAESLAAQAEDMRDSDVLPADLLMHLPYPCIYVKAPGIVEHTDGFFSWCEFDPNTEKAEFRVQWVADDMGASFPQVIHLLPGKTLRECIDDTVQTTRELWGLENEELQDVGVADIQLVLAAIQMVLYLLSVNAEVEDRIENKEGVTNQKTDGNLKTAKKDKDKAGTVQVADVGIRIGAALRRSYRRKKPELESRESGRTVGTKRTHTRRGHWHHYWTGAKNAERKLILKWTAPTIIHPEGDDSEVVVYPVKEKLE